MFYLVRISLTYQEYENKIKKLKISSGKLAKIVGMARTTPSAVWKKKDIIPIHIERFLEVFEKLPEDERVLFIHHKLKESDN
jgi:methyl coenzyme M reductase subunit C-like uncharacterized protein (methanogenesis marker protein 7)